MSNLAVATSSPQWTVNAFRAFWKKPDKSMLPAVLGLITEDIVGHWPQPIGVVRGAHSYLRVIEQILELCPDFALSVPDHASSGDLHFVRWVATGTGPDGPFEFNGVDRVRTRDGLVCENYIFCDHPLFAQALKQAA